MKILWFSNRSVLNNAMKESGTWLLAMARLLSEEAGISLVNVTINSDLTSTEIECNYSDKIVEYLLPDWKLTKAQLPHLSACEAIRQICVDVAPDIIHVWGVENYFCRLLPELELSAPALLEIQGLKSSCSDVYYGDLSPAEILRTFRIRELLFPLSKSIFAFCYRMRNEGANDMNIVNQYRYISTQSSWVRQRIKILSESPTIFETRIALRSEFLHTAPWEYPEGSCPSFYVSAAGAAPYKSIQTALRALKLLKAKRIKAKLYVIGDFVIRGMVHTSGYLYFIHDLIDHMELRDDVIFTGPLNASAIVDTMKKCIAYIQTSYVESYSLAVAEAQAVGVPCIMSYAGAMPELAVHEISGLFYSPGDYVACAGLMQKLIIKKDFAAEMSRRSRILAHERHNEKIVLNTQLKIYKSIANEN